MSGLGATAAAGLGTKYVGSPVGDAEAIAPLLAAGAVGVAAGAVGGIAFGAAFGGPDDSEVADALDWNTHVNEFTRAREDQLQLDQTLSSLTRDVQLVENKAREQAIFRIFEQGVDNGSEADATAAAEAAIDDAYATVQKSILTSWDLRAARAEAVYTNLDIGFMHNNADSWVYPDDTTDDSSMSPQFDTIQETLLDGSQRTVTTHYYEGTEDHFSPVSVRDGTYFSVFTIAKPDPADYDSVDEGLDIDDDFVEIANPHSWHSIYQDLLDRHSDLISEVSSMVDSYYQPAADGEIDLYEAVGPQHLTDTASTAEDYQEAAMALRGMGYPMSKQVVTIEVPTDDGEGLELTGRLSWTAHSGNTLAVGQTHFAENIPGSVFAAVNLPDGVDSISDDTNTTNTTDDGDSTDGPGAEILELTDEFTIVSAEGADGVSFNDRSLASSEMTNEEINNVYKENFTANQEATETVHETATGGGGGWSGLSSGGKALIVAVLGLLGLGAVNN